MLLKFLRRIKRSAPAAIPWSSKAEPSNTILLHNWWFFDLIFLIFFCGSSEVLFHLQLLHQALPVLWSVSAKDFGVQSLTPSWKRTIYYYYYYYNYKKLKRFSSEILLTNWMDGIVLAFMSKWTIYATSLFIRHMFRRPLTHIPPLNHCPFGAWILSVLTPPLRSTMIISFVLTLEGLNLR